MERVTISKLADEVGVTADALRYYERVGLLHEPDRSAAGYRLYSPQTADRLRFIKGAQRLGLRLRDIRDLLDVVDRGLCPCGHTETLLRERLGEIDAEMTSLGLLKGELERVLSEFTAEDRRRDGRWRCKAEFIQVAKRNDSAPSGQRPRG